MILVACESTHPIEKDHSAELDKLWTVSEVMDEDIRSWHNKKNKESANTHVEKLEENYSIYVRNFKTFLSNIPKENQDSLKLYVNDKMESTIKRYVEIIGPHYAQRMKPKIEEAVLATDDLFFEDLLKMNFEDTKAFVLANDLKSKISSFLQINSKLEKACPPKHLGNMFGDETNKKFGLLKSRITTLNITGTLGSNLANEYELESPELDSCFKNMVVVTDNILVLLQESLDNINRFVDKEAKAEELTALLVPLRKKQIGYYKVFKNNFAENFEKHFLFASKKNKKLLELFEKLDNKGIDINKYARKF